jgi:hypothetical protein
LIDEKDLPKEIKMLNKLTASVLRFLALETKGLDKADFKSAEIRYAESYVKARRKLQELKSKKRLWSFVERIEGAYLDPGYRSIYRWENGVISYMTDASKSSASDQAASLYAQSLSYVHRLLPESVQRIVSRVFQDRNK